MKLSGITTLAIATTLFISGCAANEQPSPSQKTTGADNATASASLAGNLNGGGASSQAAAQEAWVASFQQANGDVTINYEPTGSGTGRESFTSGALAYAGSDRAFKKEEIAKGGFTSCAGDGKIVEFPAYISPIAVVFNVEGVKKLKLDAATIAGIFAGKITKWNDPAIATQNEGVKLPDAQIKPVHRSDKSGTTQNFTDYLSVAAKDVWTVGAIEEWPASLGGEGAQHTSGMVSAVKNGVNTIGYTDASRAGDLGTVDVKVGNAYVGYTPEAAAKIIDASPVEEGRSENDIAIKLDRKTTESGAYPIVLVSYLIGCEKYADQKQGQLVKAYFKYIVSKEAQDKAAEASGSAPLSDALRAKVEPIIDKIS